MRILVIADPHIPVPPEQYGGTERIIHLLCQGLQKQGHTVDLIAATGSRNYGGQLHVHYPPTLQIHSRAYRKIRFQLESAWISCKADVIINHGRTDYLLGLFHLNKPLICCFHNPIAQTELDWIVGQRRTNIRFVGISNSQIEGLQPHQLFQVIHNASPVKSFSFQAVPDSPPYLAFLGRLTKNKGVDIAIEVAKRTGYPLKIAGNISNEAGGQEFFESAVKPYLNNRYEWIGSVDDEQKNKFLGGATALLFPIQWDEPFGIVMAESLSCGTPIVATRRASTPEVIEHGKTGFLCNSIDEMVEAVKGINKIDRQSCRIDAETRFSADVMVKRYLELICELLD